jgi:curved DNA-binding protein CbpA
MARDPYEVLGIKRGATLAELKAAYRQLAKAPSS